MNFNKILLTSFDLVSIFNVDTKDCPLSKEVICFVNIRIKRDKIVSFKDIRILENILL